MPCAEGTQQAASATKTDEAQSNSWRIVTVAVTIRQEVRQRWRQPVPRRAITDVHPLRSATRSGSASAEYPLLQRDDFTTNFQADLGEHLPEMVRLTESFGRVDRSWRAPDQQTPRRYPVEFVGTDARLSRPASGLEFADDHIVATERKIGLQALLHRNET